MAKLLLILMVGLVFESAGVVCLKKGMNEVGEIKGYSLPEITRVLKAGLMNVKILLGVFFEAVFFASLLVLLSRSDISFLWPLTALSFVFATIAAIWFLGERVSAARWAGVVFIMIGAALISYSEHRTKALPPVNARTQAPR